jgi:hypothetical protein
MNLSPDIRAAVVLAATKHKLETSLVLALIRQESDGEVYTQRFEPAFRYFFDPVTVARRLKVSIDTEKIGQGTSYGLMQVMGATARELGFLRYFGEIFEPATNLEIGCRYLKSLINRFGSARDGIAAYNAGSPRKGDDGKLINQSYVDNILKFKAEYDGYR